MTAPLHDPKRCRSCQAPIFWARTEAGRAMPVDAAPTPDGRVVLYDRGGTVMARTLKEGEQLRPGEKGRRPHHQTCPQAKEWRQGTLKGTT
jgi:ferric-dicitrate binding protein FerR (iron transport regulator)